MEFRRALFRSPQRKVGSSRRAADGKAFEQQCGLTHACGNGLAALAANADAFVKGHVVADANELGKGGGAIADQGCALDGIAQSAVFDLVGFGACKDELSRYDFHLTAAAALRVHALLHAAHHFRGLVISPSPQIVAPPWHWRVCLPLPSPHL